VAGRRRVKVRWQFQPSQQAWEKDKQRASASSPAAVERLGEEVRRLGEALEAGTEDVVEGTVARAAHGGGVLVDPLVQSEFDRMCRVSTVALARWMAGGSPEEGRDASQEVFQHHGQMAAARAAPLNEMTKRCLRWRDSVNEVLRDSATHLGVSPEALPRALAMVQLTLDVTLVRMSEVFETERERTDEELAFMATHDALTGLPNRTLILARTEQMLVRARRRETAVAALFIEIDNIKGINETLGHDAGDGLLRAVAERLDGVVRDTDALGRVGGDEFVVVAEELSPAGEPELIAKRLQEAMGEPFELAGEQKTRVTVTTSIGIAVGERASAEELLRDADIAMFQAKRDGKNRSVVFEPGMQHAVQRRIELEIDLRDALPNDQFFLVYQPTFDLRDMRPTGVEALLRWKHATRGVVQPDDFIPLLEETGLIVEVGKWALKEACTQGATWRNAGYAIGMAVNVSGRQLDSDEFVTNVRDALSESELDAGALTLEVTETTLMRNTEESVRRLTAIKELGVRIAIDDFGTGYSSLAHLQQFPVDALKIDRSFISRLTQHPEGETLIHTLVQLGQALSIETVAEGIEQQQELSMLQEQLCDSGQGFLFARPLDVDATEAFLENWAKNGAPAESVAPASIRGTHPSTSTPARTRH
jgi:diguanylate cyclase (GGDEF)-like protein